MYDHLNSGILNGGRVGPGLNIGRVEGFPCFALLASAIKRICKNQKYRRRFINETDNLVSIL